MDIDSRSPLQPRSLHLWISLLLAAALIPALRSQNLPLRFDWITLGVAYWLVLAAQSVFVAAILCVIGLPAQQAWKPLWAKYRSNPLRILLMLLFFALLTWATSPLKALVLTADTIALLELRERRAVKNAASAFLPAAAYLFFGFLMVLAYNSVIVSARFNFACDPALAAIDRALTFGHSVGDLAHWAVQTLPLWFFRGLEFIYFGMFPQIGAAIFIVALVDGRRRALQYIGTILLSYYLALALFYLWPSQGPYYLCASHFARFPATLQSYNIQRTLIADALARFHHEPLARISTDYFIGLPCMHITQPLVVMWFLRRWRRMVIALAVYDAVLTAAVVLLEWHYVADILAGVLVALLAIAVTDGVSRANDPATVVTSR